MKSADEISADLSQRVDDLTRRSALTRSQIIEDALAHGRSLAWQEKWIAGVEAGLDDAENGAFASEEELAAVLNRRRSA